MKISRRRLLLPLGLVALAVTVCVLPLLVTGGVRGWLWWVGRQEHLTVEVARIDAPLLRPVVLHQLHFRTKSGAPLDIDIVVDRVALGLNLAALRGRADERGIGDLAIDGARVTIRKNVSAGSKIVATGWRPLKTFLADTFRISHLDLRVEQPGTIVQARDVSLSASEVEAGAITVQELTVASPLISKRFTDLRGATSWQAQRLTLGAITLTRGIDIDALTVDLSHVALQRIGLEFNVDVFGGKMRANVTSEARVGRQLWDIAGTATGISLAQMSETLAWRKHATGAVRTCKFTFRGDTADLTRSTASVWLELNDLNWAGRAADTIMVGASLYNTRLHLEQLYIKQPDNELTLSGDSPLTLRADDWLKPGVNADISANLQNVAELVQLFGARPNEYSGRVEIDGTVGFEERRRHGSLIANGELQFQDARFPQETRVTGNVNCTGSTAAVAIAELVRSGAVFDGRGLVEFGALENVRAQFFPNEPIADATTVASGACVNGLLVAPAAEGAPTATVNEIDLRGGLSATDWAISLVSGNDSAPEQRTTRTFQLCPSRPNAGELRLTATGAANAR